MSCGAECGSAHDRTYRAPVDHSGSIPSHCDCICRIGSLGRSRSSQCDDWWENVHEPAGGSLTTPQNVTAALTSATSVTPDLETIGHINRLVGQLLHRRQPHRLR